MPFEDLLSLVYRSIFVEIVEAMDKKNEIVVKDTLIRTITKDGIDYICITDIARQKNWMDPNGVIANWMRNRNTVEFLGIWETLYNPTFNPIEFEGFRQQAGLNAFTLSPTRWIEKTGAVQTDIAFEFASWISVEFRLYLVKEFQRLKTNEQQLLGWTAKRDLSKINYHIHTDAIKQNLIPPEVSEKQMSLIYANEADVLNVALFGITAKEWRAANIDLKGNIRDYATINQLICLSNLENLNAVFINDGLSQAERLRKLNSIAIQQMKVLEGVELSRKLIK